MSTSTDWVLVPTAPQEIEAVVLWCRRAVKRRAYVAAGIAVVPLPGLDWATDMAVLLKLIPEINRAFGLTPEQIERLAPERRVAVYKAVSVGGGFLVGKLITREVVLKVLKTVGVRLTTQQLSKYLPLVGSAASALLTFSALRWVCEQHIQQCVAVSRQLALMAPEPAQMPAQKMPE
jgi:uncharacterized protein (DUF697 family)